jgi:hypothetical protein
MNGMNPVKLTGWRPFAPFFLASCSALILGILSSPSAVGRDTEEPGKVKTKITFEEHVLPIFKARCVKCHAGAEPSQGLRLTTRRDILRGGQSGPAMRIAAAESSLLWEKLARCRKMARHCRRMRKD